MKKRLLLLIALLPSFLRADEVSEGEKLFALKVRPLFAEKCMACHGDEPEKLKGDFDMRTREAVLIGGETFAEDVLIPGSGEKSYLYILSTRSEKDYEMPPKEADRLTEEQTWWIRDWINANAPWPDDERVAMIQQNHAKGVQVATSKALSEDWQKRRYEAEKLWAYRPLKITSVPADAHPVDSFIDQKLTTADLKPAPPATAQELARRMSYGFTGLPPKPRDVDAFAKAYRSSRSKAVREFAETLMASPHYGEHFGRHWLDVVRYADTAGFANDYTRPNAWRYRDYVVRSFNNDKPYPDFVREQIAGDEIDESDPEKLIATGFLRMGPWEHTAMSVFRETRQMWLDDITDSVGQTFLAHAMQCAKCHDHKFDPVPTRDYYRMMAVFSTTQFADRPAGFLPSENKSGFQESDAWVKGKIAAYQKQNAELSAKMKKQKKQETGSARVGANGLDPGDEASSARIQKNISRHKWEYDRSKPIAFSVFTGSTVPVNSARGSIPMRKGGNWKGGKIEKDTILTGGDAYSYGEPVTPGALSAAEVLGKMKATAFPGSKGKRRLALADWIVEEKNPLTARVMVNRVWAWHFGKGLAGNPNNFGGTGALPTHPELLDYLADWFAKNGWSVKKLNAFIVSSAAYQRSSRHPDPDALSGRDPKGNLYATFLPRRLTAEELRDAMLSVSGELSPQLGGIPSRPDVNMEVALQPRQIMGGTASVYEPDPLPRQRNRRTLYAEKIRGLRDPFLETFNQPGPDDSCELRETSTVAPQSLTLFNSEEVLERAIAFAGRLIRESSSDSHAIRRAFKLALSRDATAEEFETCLAHWKAATAEETGRTYESKTYPISTERTVMAEKTGEPYTFTEHMPAYQTYQPDPGPADVDARTRGLAQVCLVLFNLNEFAYLD